MHCLADQPNLALMCLLHIRKLRIVHSSVMPDIRDHLLRFQIPSTSSAACIVDKPVVISKRDARDSGGQRQEKGAAGELLSREGSILTLFSRSNFARGLARTARCVSRCSQSEAKRDVYLHSITADLLEAEETCDVTRSSRFAVAFGLKSRRLCMFLR